MIGHNNPPSALAAFEAALSDARDTAADFLDGAAIETQGQADAVGKIVGEVKELRRDAEKARKSEKEPYLEAGRQVDAAWKPLLERADTIIKAAQAPLTAYLQAQEAEKRERERLAQEEAERKAQEALEAERAAKSVADLEEAQAKQKEADAAAKDAKRASKDKAQVSGTSRAIGLRTYKVVTVTDHKAALLWIAKRDKPALDHFIEEYARKHAATRPMDGVVVRDEKRAA